jgi:hypothetical protein
VFTLSQLEDKVRQRANMENSTFVSSAEVTGYINASYAELYDILVSRFEDYYSQLQAFSLSGTNTFALPVNLYKIRGVDASISGNDWQTLRRWNFDERNQIDLTRTRLLSGYNDRLYRVMGQNLIVLPQDKAAGNYQLWFIPRYTPLVGPTDPLGDVLDFEEYIVVDAAMKCLIKEESDIQELMLMKKQLKDRIEAMASNRDTQPERISDVRASEDYFLWPRGY